MAETISSKYKPGPPLDQFVDCFWYWESPPSAHAKERLMPNGEPGIVFNLRDNPFRIYDAQDLNRFSSYGTAVFSGAGTEGFVIDTDSEECVFGIQFKPGGSFPFSKVPASEFANRSLPLDDLWRQNTAQMRDRLLSAATVAQKFSVAEACLLQQLVRPLELHPAVRVALHKLCRAPHLTPVSSLPEQVGLSQRYFIQTFQQQVGLTPKAFCRVRRFQHVLHAVHGKKEVDWAMVALDCGYYDQPHFIHDFKLFSGFTPSQYLARVTEHLNHVPIA
jgi:AraC-like DNA-binding protein